MSDITLTFHAFLIGTEGIGTADEGDYLDGEVDFDAVIDGFVYRGLVAKVKQTAGSSFAEPLEVEWPDRIADRFMYGAFRECVEQYVRREVSERVIGARRRPDPSMRIDHVGFLEEASCETPGRA
jgi:hypothetical protein